MSRNILTIFFIFFTIIFGFFFLWPKFQEFRASQANLKEKEIELQGKGEFFIDLKEISQKIKEYQEPLSKINTALPPEPSLVNLFDFLQNLSSRYGLIIKKIDSLGTNPSSDFPQLKESLISLEVSGDYPSFKNFLSLLEESARLIEVENVSFSSSSGEEFFTFQLKMKVYSY